MDAEKLREAFLRDWDAMMVGPPDIIAKKWWLSGYESGEKAGIEKGRQGERELLIAAKSLIVSLVFCIQASGHDEPGGIPARLIQDAEILLKRIRQQESADGC